MEEKHRQANTKLRRERELRGWSQRALAEMVGTSEQVFNRWEAGEHKPNRYFQTQLCKLFGKNAEELGFMNKQGPINEDAHEHTSHGRDIAQIDFSQSHTLSSSSMKQGKNLVEDDVDMQRRHMLQQLLMLGSTIFTSAENIDHFNLFQEGPLSNTLPLTTLYEHVLSSCWKLYYAGHSSSLIPIVDGCLRSLITTLKAAHSPEQQLPLLCHFYQLSGVLARDGMHITRALSDGKKAIEIAFETENGELIAASLFRRAKTYLRQQEYDKAVQDVEVALLYAKRVRNPLKGYIHQMAAQVYAPLATQDILLQKKCLLLLDAVENILTHGNLEDDGSFVKLNIAGLSIDRASILTRFQQPQEASQVLASIRQQLGSEVTRWQVRLSLADGETYIAQHDPESCCMALFQALRIARATGSRSNEARIVSLYQQLHTLYPRHILVLQLEEQLRAQYSAFL